MAQLSQVGTCCKNINVGITGSISSPSGEYSNNGMIQCYMFSVRRLDGKPPFLSVGRNFNDISPGTTVVLYS